MVGRWLVVYLLLVKQIHRQFLYTTAQFMAPRVLSAEVMENSLTWSEFRIIHTRDLGYWFGMTMPRLVGGSFPGMVDLCVQGKNLWHLPNGLKTV